MSDKEKMYSREEVVDALTLLFKELTGKYTDCGCSFEWEKSQSLPFHNRSEYTMYSAMFGQVMSIIESSVEGSRVEATKTVARQLLNTPRNEVMSQTMASMRVAVNNTGDHIFSSDSGWEKIRELLKKD